MAEKKGDLLNSWREKEQLRMHSALGFKTNWKFIFLRLFVFVLKDLEVKFSVWVTWPCSWCKTQWFLLQWAKSAIQGQTWPHDQSLCFAYFSEISCSCRPGGWPPPKITFMTMLDRKWQKRRTSNIVRFGWKSEEIFIEFLSIIPESLKEKNQKPRNQIFFILNCQKSTKLNQTLILGHPVKDRI